MNNEELHNQGDRFLIEAVQAGAQDAFQRLVDRYSGRLKAFAARRLAGTGMEPEDAVQETFLGLLRNLDRLGEVRSLQAYLFTILRRRIIDFIRRRGPAAGAVAIEPGRSSSPGFEPASPEATPSTYARRDEAAALYPQVLADVLAGLLAGLKRDRQFRELKVLELVFRENKSQQEAARLAGTSEATVSRTIAASVARLKKLAARHPKADALQDLPEGGDANRLIHAIWQDQLFTCLKRSTLGSHALGVLDNDWADYARFHLDTIQCEYCAAHLEDITRPDKALSTRARQTIFQSSAGFLKS